MSIDRIHQLGDQINEATDVLQGSLGDCKVIVVKREGHFQIRQVKTLWDEFLQLLSYLGIGNGKDEALRSLYFSAKELSESYEEAVEKMKTTDAYSFSEIFLKLQKEQELVQKAAGVLDLYRDQDSRLFGKALGTNVAALGEQDQGKQGGMLADALQNYGQQVDRRLKAASVQVDERMGKWFRKTQASFRQFKGDEVPQLNKAIKNNLRLLALHSAAELHRNTLATESLAQDLTAEIKPSKLVSRLSGITKSFGEQLQQLTTQDPVRVAEAYLIIEATLTRELKKFDAFLEANPEIKNMHQQEFGELAEMKDRFTSLKQILLGQMVAIEEEGLAPYHEAIQVAQIAAAKAELTMKGAGDEQRVADKEAQEVKIGAVTELSEAFKGRENLLRINSTADDITLLRLLAHLVNSDTGDTNSTAETLAQQAEAKKESIQGLAQDLGIDGPLSGGAFLSNQVLKSKLESLGDSDKEGAQQTSDKLSGKLDAYVAQLRTKYAGKPALGLFDHYQGQPNTFIPDLQIKIDQLFPPSLYWTAGWDAESVTADDVLKEAKRLNKQQELFSSSIIDMIGARSEIAEIGKLQSGVERAQMVVNRRETFNRVRTMALNTFSRIEQASVLVARADKKLQDAGQAHQTALTHQSEALRVLEAAKDRLQAAKQAHRELLGK